MALIAGVDGCPAGWVCITMDTQTGLLSSALFRTAADFLSQQPGPEVVAIDIPIGLTDAGRRLCDEQARALLGTPRRNSVFPAPIRAALEASTRALASQITSAADGRRVGVQAWGIYLKVREVDQQLAADPALRQAVHEVHPELCFWAWNGSQAMAHGKKTQQGQAERRALIDARYGGQAVAQVRIRYRVGQVGNDDFHDAFAALWTAERILAGAAVVIPDSPPVDAAGLRMGIWY